MCLLVNKEMHDGGKPLIANEDITVYKFLVTNNHVDFYTPYYHLKIAFKNDICKLPKIKRLNPEWEYYNPSLWKTTPLLVEICVNKGYHSYTKLSRAYDQVSAYLLNNECSDCTERCKSAEVMEAYIPKGASYFVGSNDDIVSTELVIKKRYL